MKLVRMLGALALGAAVVIGGMAGTAVAQTETEPADCYPIPPGGCPTEEPDCDDLLAAVEAGQITEEQLPEECRPEEEEEPTEEPTPDPTPEPTEEPTEEPTPEPEEEVDAQIADTGAPVTLLLLGASALVGVGGTVVGTTRRRRDEDAGR